MVQGYIIETVFENGKAVEPAGIPAGPTGAELIAESDKAQREAVAEGMAHWARLEKDFKERQSAGRIEIEVIRIGSFTLEAAASTERFQ